MMKNNKPLFSVFLICLACVQPENPISDGKINQNTISVIETDTVEILKNPFDDSLRLYFEEPVDFYALKKQTDHMLSGGSFDLKEEYFHRTNNPDVIFYGYMSLELIGTKNFSDDNLIFVTWKPWKTAQQKYYETDNETLVGIRCKINWHGLGKSNFVGMHIDSLKTKFGEPHAVDNTYSTFYNSASLNPLKDIVRTTSIYFREDKILLLNEKNKKVTWFKYYWWHENITEINSLPRAIFEWPPIN